MDNELHDRLSDSLTNYETIKYFNNEKYERQKFHKSVTEYQKFSMATQSSLSILNISQQLLIGMSLILSLVLIARQTITDGLSLGTFVAVNAYVLNVFAPLNFLGTIYNMIVTSMIDMRSFGQLLSEPYDITDTAIPLKINLNDISSPMVEFDNVTFRYREHPQLGSVRGLSFTVSSNTTTAFIGQTGSGKTTIGRLLFRFFDPQSGRILIQNQNINSVSLSSLRNCLGVVPQDVVLFNDTIAHNIRYGNLNASDEEVRAATASAQLIPFIDAQPLGLNTIVGERGLKLSGGEKQRVAIARCILKNPPIVLLDEATSALDSATEAIIQEALNTLLGQNRTCLVIAHRLGTIKNAEQIIILDNGLVVARGTHGELMEASDIYSGMWKRQQGDIS